MNADWQLICNSLKPKYSFMKSHMEATIQDLYISKGCIQDIVEHRS